MTKIMLLIKQSLEAAAPADEEVLEDAILTIKDPEPYVVEEAFEMHFHFEVKSADVHIDDGKLAASRELEFTLDIQDEDAATTWLLQEGFIEEGEGLANADWSMAVSNLIGDYEGSFVGDDMVEFENSVAIVG